MRDSLVNKLLNYYNLSNGLLVYSIITTSPTDMAIALLCSKLGLSKIIISIIIAFLL